MNELAGGLYRGANSDIRLCIWRSGWKYFSELVWGFRFEDLGSLGLGCRFLGFLVIRAVFCIGGQRGNRICPSLRVYGFEGFRDSGLSLNPKP